METHALKHPKAPAHGRKHFFFAIAALIFLAGCCTKKDCDFTEDLSLIITVSTDSIKGFSHDQINNLVVQICDENFNVLNSYRPWDNYSNSDNIPYAVFHLDNYMIKGKMGKGDISSYNYLFVIQDSIKIDTLSRVKYSLHSEKISCNSCFPFGDGSATQTTINNFSCLFNSEIITNKTDTLKIER